MKALSLTRPWATLIAIGGKRVETRSWSTTHRGQIAIHASKGFPKWARDFATTEHTLGRLLSPIPTGGIIALARIVKVERTQDVEQSLSALERLYGDYSFGRYAWFLEDVIKLPQPVVCKGALSLWEVSSDVLRLIQAQVG